MEGSTPPTLEERIARLERMVEEIHARLGATAERSAPPVPAPPPAPAPVPGKPREAPGFVRSLFREEVWEHQSEQWLGRVGLFLLFLGLVYLFNYSIEQGWITPLVRVAVGLTIGGVLLVVGLRLQERRRSYSQLLLAGSLAAFYVSGFAAFQLYHLVSYGLAFVYLAGVTALGLGLARRQDHPSLASLGALGGLATPLLLHRQTPAVIEIAAYSALVVGWTGILYWLRGWPSLLWTYTVGGLAALTVAGQHALGGDRWIVEAAFLLTWALGAVAPFVRGVLREESRLELRRSWGRVPISLQLRVLGVGATSYVLFATDAMWDLPDHSVGGLFLLAAAGYALFTWWGTRTPNLVARAAAPVAAALCATGTFLVLDGHPPTRMAVLAIEALLFVYAGSLPRLAGVESVGHALFGLLAFDLLKEAFVEEPVAFDLLALAQLLTIGLGLAASLYATRARSVLAYRLGAHAFFLLWLAKELGALPAGTGVVTLAWGAYGAILLILAVQWRDRRSALTHGLQMVAFSALALAVGKLLLVDLERVAMLWRIFLFMGFGAAFLGLSSLFKPKTPPDAKPAP